MHAISSFVSVTNFDEWKDIFHSLVMLINLQFRTLLKRIAHRLTKYESTHVSNFKLVPLWIHSSLV